MYAYNFFQRPKSFGSDEQYDNRKHSIYDGRFIIAIQKGRAEFFSFRPRHSLLENISYIESERRNIITIPGKGISLHDVRITLKLQILFSRLGKCDTFFSVTKKYYRTRVGVLL